MDLFNKVITSERLKSKSLENYLAIADKEPSEAYILMWSAEDWQMKKMWRAEVYNRCKKYHIYCVQRYLNSLI